MLQHAGGTGRPERRGWCDTQLLLSCFGSRTQGFKTHTKFALVAFDSFGWKNCVAKNARKTGWSFGAVNKCWSTQHTFSKLGKHTHSDCTATVQTHHKIFPTCKVRGAVGEVAEDGQTRYSQEERISDGWESPIWEAHPWSLGVCEFLLSVRKSSSSIWGF